jgi:NAD(P)-dependent dehydrogenase (short-subunit alcohol dehydrogenase family)
MQRFKNKTIIVTGAASGIGQACALRFATEGASVLCLDLNEKGLEATLTRIKEHSKDAIASVLATDISDEEAVKQAVTQCIARYKRLDVVAHMAGILDFEHTVHMDLARWRRIMSVNLDGTFLICRETLPHLEKYGGNIINASSSSALVGLAYGAAYGASKGGVLGLTRAIAMEYVRRGVRANCVCPAGIKTPMTAGPRMPENMDMELLGRHEMISGKHGEPEQVASVVAMLASEDSSHITGEEVRVDGGALS